MASAGSSRELRRFVGARLRREARSSLALGGAVLVGFSVVGLVAALFDEDRASGNVGLILAFAFLGLGLLGVARLLGKVGRRRSPSDD